MSSLTNTTFGTVDLEFGSNLTNATRSPLVAFADRLSSSMVENATQTDVEKNIAKATQLKQFGFTFSVGLAVLAVTLFLFAVAVRFRQTHIAPRCEARPRNVIYNPSPMRDPSQDRGNPFLLGWVFWVLNLSYNELIRGVPGTGTRKGGLEGKMLSVNLDHIILLRFNALGLKISTVAMVVYCTICLPIYFYSRCAAVPLGDVDQGFHNCTNEIDNNYTLTSYSRFTLANIPDLRDGYFEKSHHIAAFEMYCVALASWLVLWFACFELFHEWIDVLSMRRVYYLEKDHWNSRQAELEATMLERIDDVGAARCDEEVVSEKHIIDRAPWIPHPEQRDTPANIELYSVLVGGVPSKPKEVVASEDLEGALANNAHAELDWQLSVTSAFFDSCVPNQPGFSSSLAAVTILPSAGELALAWKRWSNAAKKISRLRFIRSRIRELGHVPQGQKLLNAKPDKSTRVPPQGTNPTSRAEQTGDVFASVRGKEYSAEVLGGGLDDDINDDFWKSLNLGPEQIGVYNREMSKAVAGCCPYGTCDQRVKYCKDINKLLEMEEEASDDMNEAYLQLEEAGNKAAFSRQKRVELPTMAGLANVAGLSPMTGLLFHSCDKGVVEPHHSTTEAAAMKRRQTLERKASSTGDGSVLQFQGTRNNGKTLPLSGLHHQDCEESSRPATNQEEPTRDLHAGLMRLASVRLRSSQIESPSSKTQSEVDPWELVQTLAQEAKNSKRKKVKKYKVSNGRWTPPSLRSMLRGIRSKLGSLLMWTSDNSHDATDVMARDSTFAVVTFTSRQAAIAARKCLADGRGAGSFKTVEALPVPPLADSAAFNVCDCRGFLKPVTIGLNEHQKNWRKGLTIVCLVIIYVFYQVPIAICSYGATEAIYKIFPGISDTFDYNTISGFINSSVLSLFLAFLPDIFLFLANFGSNATSLVASENAALQYFWYFMMVYVIVGQTILTIGIEAYQTGSLNLNHNLRNIASAIPVEISALWMNWIITKTTIYHPLFYLLQGSTWVFAIIGAKCCVRMFRGGGSGNRLPYRIYVESGTVLMCVLALAPAAPILSPFAVLYFLVCTPLLRFVVIFTFKPPYDSGGARWPLLFDMIIASLMAGQILLAYMLLLKQAVGPAIVAFVPFFPTLGFHRMARMRFLPAYKDAGLVQMSLLDGWDVGAESEHWTYDRREQFRRFLVDAHKGAFVPVCIAAVNAQNIITAEPAVVQPLTEEEAVEDIQSINSDTLKSNSIDGSSPGTQSGAVGNRRAMFGDRRKQFGALDRRHLLSGRNLLDTSSDQIDTSPALNRRHLLSRRNLGDTSDQEYSPRSALESVATSLAVGNCEAVGEANGDPSCEGIGEASDEASTELNDGAKPDDGVATLERVSEGSKGDNEPGLLSQIQSRYWSIFETEKEKDK